MSRPILDVTKLLSVVLLSGCLLLATVGCAENEAGLAEQDQSAQNAADRIRELEDQLTQAETDRITDQEKILRLQAELDQLRDQAKGPAPGWESVPGGAMTSIEGTVLFDSGKAQLKSSGKTLLNQIANVISGDFAGCDIYVFGHTDNEPIKHSGWKDNYELSCQRALTVVRALRNQGVTTQVAACGWGEYRPVMDNANAKTRQVNRRVEIFAMRPKAKGTASAAFPANR